MKLPRGPGKFTAFAWHDIEVGIAQSRVGGYPEGTKVVHVVEVTTPDGRRWVRLLLAYPV